MNKKIRLIISIALWILATCVMYQVPDIMKKFILAIFVIAAIGLFIFFVLFWYVGINAIPIGGE